MVRNETGDDDEVLEEKTGQSSRRRMRVEIEKRGMSETNQERRKKRLPETSAQVNGVETKEEWQEARSVMEVKKRKRKKTKKRRKKKGLEESLKLTKKQKSGRQNERGMGDRSAQRESGRRIFLVLFRCSHFLPKNRKKNAFFGKPMKGCSWQSSF